jgi:hypothetical protein
MTPLLFAVVDAVLRERYLGPSALYFTTMEEWRRRAERARWWRSCWAV